MAKLWNIEKKQHSTIDQISLIYPRLLEPVWREIVNNSNNDLKNSEYLEG